MFAAIQSLCLLEVHEYTLTVQTAIGEENAKVVETTLTLYLRSAFRWVYFEKNSKLVELIVCKLVSPELMESL